MTDVALLVVGIVMLVGLFALAGSLGQEDARMRRRWDARFDTEARVLRRTDATGVLMCRGCGASGSERAGTCPKCGAIL
jgi:rubrerythrin